MVAEYEKKIQLFDGMVYAAVYRDRYMVESEWHTACWPIGRERAFKRAHAWADRIIADMQKWEENT